MYNEEYWFYRILPFTMGTTSVCHTACATMNIVKMSMTIFFLPLFSPGALPRCTACAGTSGIFVPFLLNVISHMRFNGNINTFMAMVKNGIFPYTEFTLRHKWPSNITFWPFYCICNIENIWRDWLTFPRPGLPFPKFVICNDYIYEATISPAGSSSSCETRRGVEECIDLVWHTGDYKTPSHFFAAHLTLYNTFLLFPFSHQPCEEFWNILTLFAKFYSKLLSSPVQSEESPAQHRPESSIAPLGHAPATVSIIIFTLS